jgi:hypothetical protein
MYVLDSTHARHGSGQYLPKESPTMSCSIQMRETDGTARTVTCAR